MERPEFSLLLIDAANPFRYLVIRGRVELSLDPDHIWADKMSAKYGRDMREMLTEGENRYHLTFWPQQHLGLAGRRRVTRARPLRLSFCG